MNNIPVTVAVMSYNSAHTLEDTLISVAEQDYGPIELIISDDGSTDGSVELAEAWLNKPEYTRHFANTRLLTVPQNTGVAANCNRVLAAAGSDWIKFLAADDILLPGCLSANMTFVAEHPAARVVFSKVEVYLDTFEPQNHIDTQPYLWPSNLFREGMSAQDQYEVLLFSDRINYTPSFFFHKTAIQQVGGYDEEHKLIEDYPMWLKLTRSGILLHYHHTPTVGYRMHARSTYNKSEKTIFKPFSLQTHSIRRKMAHPYLPWEIAGLENYQYYVKLVFQKLGLNRDKLLLRRIFKLFSIYLNPFQYIYAIKKRMNKNRTSPFYR